MLGVWTRLIAGAATEDALGEQVRMPCWKHWGPAVNAVIAMFGTAGAVYNKQLMAVGYCHVQL
jgi:hypothetical protein